jgi:hypothetical protein
MPALLMCENYSIISYPLISFFKVADKETCKTKIAGVKGWKPDAESGQEATVLLRGKDMETDKDFVEKHFKSVDAVKNGGITKRIIDMVQKYILGGEGPRAKIYMEMRRKLDSDEETKDLDELKKQEQIEAAIDKMSPEQKEEQKKLEDKYLLFLPKETICEVLMLTKEGSVGAYWIYTTKDPCKINFNS